ncbi:trihelix transcription factor ASR3-like [Impatiens glandulifera]|uniref:trihelix transcription factor ASR3-like n=1 Tax=Impatiens glandulifera TaxID=253017 RepID=UPI001FB0E91D|nr:trihelix transcription factor ASR3-like [Impatiens glandulifera]
MASKTDESPTNNLHSTDHSAEIQVEIQGIAEVSKRPQHPKWSIRETHVLIEGKFAEENLRRNGEQRSNVILTSKWEAISSFCTKNGMKRGAIQCQNRWSRLMELFRKIKMRESVNKDEDKSFWNMTAKERSLIKLPKFFDKDVYDVLDGNPWCASAISLNQVATNDSSKKLPNLDMKKNKPIYCPKEATSQKPGKKRRLFENGNEEVNMESENGNEQDNILIVALNKIGDALGRIADKL